MATKGKQEEEKSPTNDFIDKCKKELCHEKVAAQSKEDACCTDVNSQDQDNQYKICCLVTTQKTNQFYQNFKFCIGQPGARTGENTEAKIEELIKKEEDLKTKFKDLTKMIKSSRDKMKAAVECACGLERCFDEEERCNPDILKALEDGIPGFKSQVLECSTETEKCYEKLNTAFDSAIDISGILTFSDVDSLQAPAKGLVAKMKALTEDYESVIGTTTDRLKEDIRNLTECIDTRQDKSFACCFTTVELNALTMLYNFICDPECADKDPARIQEICKKFIEDIPEDDQDDDCTDDRKRDDMKARQIREDRKV